LSMTSAHSQTHTKAMSSHLYYAHAHASDQTVLLCVYVECTEQTQQDYIVVVGSQDRQDFESRETLFTEKLKAEKKGVPRSRWSA